MQINVIASSPQLEALIERFTLFLCSELEISPKKVEITSVDLDDLFGMCIDMSPSEFVIMVKETGRELPNIMCTIAHEMIHVKQHLKENLSSHLHNCDIPYMDRWWEKEAYSKAPILVEKFAQRIVDKCM